MYKRPGIQSLVAYIACGFGLRLFRLKKLGYETRWSRHYSRRWVLDTFMSNCRQQQQCARVEDIKKKKKNTQGDFRSDGTDRRFHPQIRMDPYTPYLSLSVQK